MRNATLNELISAALAAKEGRPEDCQSILEGTHEAAWDLAHIKARIVGLGGDRLERHKGLLAETPDVLAVNEQISQLGLPVQTLDLPPVSAYGELPIHGHLQVPRPAVSKILVGHGTPLACTSCHRVEMPAYYLKRNNGKYDVLCFDNGQGCWERSGRGLCTYLDREDAQCIDLAEFTIVYSSDKDFPKRAVCGRHVPAVLTGASSYRIFPIDVDIPQTAITPSLAA